MECKASFPPKKKGGGGNMGWPNFLSEFLLAFKEPKFALERFKSKKKLFKKMVSLNIAVHIWGPPAPHKHDLNGDFQLLTTNIIVCFWNRNWHHWERTRTRKCCFDVVTVNLLCKFMAQTQQSQRTNSWINEQFLFRHIPRSIVRFGIKTNAALFSLEQNNIVCNQKIIQLCVGGRTILSI